MQTLRRLLTLLAVPVFLTQAVLGQDFEILRSEYLKSGDSAGTFLSVGLGIVYDAEILSGNEEGYYSIRRSIYQNQPHHLVVEKPIPEVVGVVTEHNLVVQLTGTKGKADYHILVRDGFDHLVATWPHTQVINTNQGIARRGSWTAYNNLWGDGTAVPNTDYRWAILVNEDLPDNSLIVWDMPGPASDYGGASVWGYSQLFVGNRSGMVDDVPGFPVLLDDLTAANLEFDFEIYPGNDQFKIALNMFWTDEPGLVPFESNDGDFFFVFDQLGTYVPPVPDDYAVDMGNVVIDGHTFARLYDNDNGYERRRFIVRNNDRYARGTLNLLEIFNQFSDRGYLNRQQSFPAVMIGVEVTSGFGAVGIRKLDLDLQRRRDPAEARCMGLDLENAELQYLVPAGTYGWLEFNADLNSDWQTVPGSLRWVADTSEPFDAFQILSFTGLNTDGLKRFWRLVYSASPDPVAGQQP